MDRIIKDEGFEARKLSWQELGFKVGLKISMPVQLAVQWEIQ
jgi:hypothetical protein